MQSLGLVTPNCGIQAVRTPKFRPLRSRRPVERLDSSAGRLPGLGHDIAVAEKKTTFLGLLIMASTHYDFLESSVFGPQLL